MELKEKLILFKKPTILSQTVTVKQTAIDNFPFQQARVLQHITANQAQKRGSEEYTQLGT